MKGVKPFGSPGRASTAVVIVALAFLVGTSSAWAAAKIKVVTVTTDLAALTKAVGGDRVEVESLMRGYQDPHTVEVKPSYMLKLKKADLFIKVGLDFELWSPVIVDGSRNPKIFPGTQGYLDASRGVEILEVPTARMDRSMGDIHLYGNPHYWQDPLNGKVILENITNALTRISPDDADYFRKNKEAYAKKIDEALQRWLSIMEPYRGTKVVTYHSSWPNFAKRFGLQIVGFIEPKPGVPPSPSYILSLIERMKREGVKIIIMEPYFQQDIPRLVAEKTGAKIVVLPPSVGGEKGADDYIALFDHNLGKLITAFKEAGVKPTAQARR